MTLNPDTFMGDIFKDKLPRHWLSIALKIQFFCVSGKGNNPLWILDGLING